LEGAVQAKYGKIARALHWVIALPMIAMLLLGEETMGSHNAGFLQSLHASTGLVLFLLGVCRIAWRFKNPPLPGIDKSIWEMLLARTVHGLLYFALFAIPFSGWLAYTEHVRRSFGAPPASWFGFAIPLLPDFAINWHRIHNWGGKLVLAIIALHVLAALKHHFYDRDGTLERMWL
jgi:cytochrome b561